MKSFFLLSLIFFTTSCAFGPLMMNETATTVGRENSDLNIGYGAAGYVAKYNYGILDNLDFGVQYENFSLGARLKYAFINNNTQGFSFATAVGTGASMGGSHNYVDIIGSYKSNKLEPYFGYRYVSVKTDPVEFEENDEDDDVEFFDFTIDNFKFKYGQAFLGFRYWVSQKWSVNGEVSKLMSIEDINLNDSGVLYAASFSYRFY